MSAERIYRGFIKLEPKWRGLVPVYIAAFEHGSPEAKSAARAELLRMAQAADNWNEHAKAKGMPDA